MTRTFTYGAYGERGSQASASRAAFAGEIVESDTGWYMLGNRLYSPVLRRFLAPDPESPFNEGGFNRYAYCSGDPVNRIDPAGNAWTDWLASGLMVGLAIVGSALSAWTLAAPLAAATAAGMAASTAGAGVVGSVAAAAATPGVVAASLAAAMDVYSTVAAIGSIAAMATQNSKVSSILGWISMGTGIASGVSGITAARQLSRVPPKPRWPVPQRSPPPSVRRAAIVATGRPTVSVVSTAAPGPTSGASSRTGGRDSARSLVTPDAIAELPQVKVTLAELKQHGASGIPAIVGAGGSREAFQNPHGNRRRSSEEPYLPDTRRIEQAGTSAGVEVDAMDTNVATNEQLRRRLSDHGMYTVPGGLGLVDPATLTSLNMRDTVSTFLVSARAGL